MSQSDRAIKKLATQLARLDREVKSWRGAQADYTSIENGGNFTFKDGDGNVTAIVGGQDDGSNTIRHVDGPVPPVPSGLTAHVDGPIVQVSWDGSFEDADNATYDWSHLEVIVVGPGNEQLTATINDITGASASVAATASGEWTVVARSVSRAGKRSLDGDAGTVEVEIVGLSGAIEDAIGSANGKNTVTYSETPPSPEDEGIAGDTWFVNSVDPETSIMLITEQWQYLDSAWVQTELDHEVIATIDAGKITVGELDGIRIMANTIGAETLTADAIDGKVITGATIRSAASGARTLMSTSGFEAYDNSGKRTFFASASTGSVSMTGELYTGDPGSERVVLDNSLWGSVQITDPDTGAVKNTPGAGVRIGVSSSSGADIYHGATTSSSGRYVDQAVLRGPSGRARTIYGSVSAGGGLPASNYVTSTASDDSGKIAAEYRVTVGGIGSATRKVELIGSDTNGNSRALIRASGGNGKSNMWGLDENGVETSEVASDGANRAAWMRGADSSGASTAFVGTYGNSGSTAIDGSNQRPLNINYTGSSNSWFVPFRKSGTEWGYVGSTGAMGVNEFGIQSASGKNLVLRTTNYEDSVELLGAGGQFGIVRDGGAKVRSTTIAGVSGSPGTTGAPVYIRTSSGNMFISSSSRRYKTNITDARELPGLLDVSVRTWQDKADVELAERLKEFREETGEGPVPQSLADAEVDVPRNFGAVAEEVDELGLTELVRYDAYGRPDGLLYEMFGVALIPEIRKLRDRITELERLTNE